jgi:hypothetical protein
VTVDHGEGGGEEIYCKPVGTTVILKTAASILRVIAGIVAPLPFWAQCGRSRSRSARSSWT